MLDTVEKPRIDVHIYLHKRLVMEKEKLLSTLTEKLGKTSFSSQTIETYLDLNPLEEGVEPDDAYWQKAVNFLGKMQGQFNHDVAAAITKQKALPNEENGNEKKEVSGLPENIVKLLEDIKGENKKLKARLDEEDKRRAATALREQVAEGMKAKNASNAYVLRNVLRDAEMDASKSVDELVTEYLKKYDVELREANPSGYVPREVTEGSKEAKVTDSYFKKKAEREGWSKKENS